MISHGLFTWITLILLTAGTMIGLLGMIARKKGLQRIGCLTTAVAFLFQTATLCSGFHKSFAGGLSSGAYLQMLAWFVCFSALVLWLRFKLASALTLAAPFCAALFAISLPLLDAAIRIPNELSTSFYVLHVASLFISLAAMALSCIASVLFLFLERRIKSKQRVQGFLKDIPALSVLDTINGICLLTAFPAYTIGILTGLVRAQSIFGATFTGDPKEIISFIVWGLLAFVFHNRLASSWTGRKPALTMVFIFGLSLFSLLIINTVMDSHHAFLAR